MDIAEQTVAFQAVDRSQQPVVALESAGVDLPEVAFQNQDRAFRDAAEQQLHMFPGQVFRFRTEYDGVLDVPASQEAKVHNLNLAVLDHEVQLVLAADVIGQRHGPDRHFVIVVALQVTDRIGILHLYVVAHPDDAVERVVLQQLERAGRGKESFAGSKGTGQAFDGRRLVQQHINGAFLLRVLGFYFTERGAFHRLAPDLLVLAVLPFISVNRPAFRVGQQKILIFLKVENVICFVSIDRCAFRRGSRRTDDAVVGR